VEVDAWNYQPVSYEILKAKMSKKLAPHYKFKEELQENANCIVKLTGAGKPFPKQIFK